MIVFLPDLAFYELIYNLKKQDQAKDLIKFLEFLIESPNVFTYKMDNKEFLDITKISLRYNLTTYDSSYLFLSLAT
jgi:predicted nucleic acid-binding protein